VVKGFCFLKISLEWGIVKGFKKKKAPLKKGLKKLWIILNAEPTRLCW